MQYDICEQFVKCPGPQFGAVCLSHYVLPMLQQWLRREAKHGLPVDKGTRNRFHFAGSGWRENRASVRNFKQAVGLVTESVVTYLSITGERKCS